MDFISAQVAHSIGGIEAVLLQLWPPATEAPSTNSLHLGLFGEPHAKPNPLPSHLGLSVRWAPKKQLVGPDLRHRAFVTDEARDALLGARDWGLLQVSALERMNWRRAEHNHLLDERSLLAPLHIYHKALSRTGCINYTLNK